MRTVTKKLVGLAAVAMALGAAMSVPAHAATKVVVAQSTTSLGSLFTHVAIDKGFAASNGLEIEFFNVSAGSQIQAALVGDRAQYTIATVDNFLSWQKSSDMRVFREMLGKNYFEVVIRKDFWDSSVPNKVDFKAVMQSLAKSKLGVTAPGLATEMLWRQLFEGAGVAFEGTYIGGSTSAPNIAAQFTAKAVDAVVTFEPVRTLLVEGLSEGSAPLGVMPFSVKQPFKGRPTVVDSPGLSIGSTAKWLTENVATARQIDKTYDQAVAWAKNPKNFKELTNVIVNRLQLDSRVAPFVARDFLNQVSVTGAVNKAAWDLVGAWTATNTRITDGKVYGASTFVVDLSSRQIRPLAVGGSVTVTELVSRLVLKPRAGATIEVSVSKSSKAQCSYDAAKKVVRATKRGVCDLTVSVTDPKKIGQQPQTRESRAFIEITR